MTMRKTQLQLSETQHVGESTLETLVTTQQVPLLEHHGISMVGVSQAKAGFYFVRPNPNFAQVLATVAGYGMVRVGEDWQELRPGMAYLMPAHVLSAYYAPDTEVWSLLWVHLHPTALNFPSRDALVLEKNLRALQATLEGLIAEAHGLAEPEPLADWVRLLACELRRLVSGTARNTLRLSPLWGEVQANLAHHWTREELSGRLNLSGERLRKLCQESLGMSPMAYVTQLRMQHAASLLASGRYSVTQVAYRVGYENTLAFSTAFKRVTGTTPSSCLPRHR
jgi:AraC-like DNA-binding protein